MIRSDTINGAVDTQVYGRKRELFEEFACVSMAILAVSKCSKEELIAIINKIDTQKTDELIDKSCRIFVRRLSHLLELKGYKAIDFARDVKVEPKMMEKYMNGKSLPMRDELERMSKKLDVSMDYLLGVNY